MKVLSTQTHLVDTAVGPVSVVSQEVVGYDVDDYVHSSVREIAQRLRLYKAAIDADDSLSSGRIPVQVGNIRVGGFRGQ